jgi:VIT1/CCC1 family predicted Fe2+/Mn2+ transporter
MFTGGTILKKRLDADAAKETARSDLVAKINEEGGQAKGDKPESEKEKRKKLALAQTQDFHYEKTLKPKYMKEIKNSFRSSLQDHGVWFAPAMDSDAISTLVASTSDDELIVLTTQLCVALGVALPVAPYKPGQEKTTAPPVVPARTLIRQLHRSASDTKLSASTAA